MTRFNVTVGLILLGRLALTVYYSVLTELPDFNSWIVGDKSTASNPKNSGQSSVIIKHVFTIITVNSRGSIKCIPLHLHIVAMFRLVERFNSVRTDQSFLCISLRYVNKNVTERPYQQNNFSATNEHLSSDWHHTS